MTSVCPHGVKMGWACESCQNPPPALDPHDLKVDEFRHAVPMNMLSHTLSSVRITHVPTDQSVVVVGKGSQLKLKSLAMKALTELVTGA